MQTHVRSGSGIDDRPSGATHVRRNGAGLTEMERHGVRVPFVCLATAHVAFFTRKNIG